MIPGQLEALFSFLLTVGLVLPGQSYNVVSRSTFSRVQNSAKHSENTPWAHRMAMCACVDPHACMRWSADFSKKRVFRGEKGHGPGQSKDLETRIKTPTIQCKNPPTGIPNFEWRAAAAGLKPLVAARLRCASASCRRVGALAHVCRIKITFTIQAIPLGVTFSNAVSKLKAQSSTVSFH